MKIKVCGMRDPRNIRKVASLDIDFMGFIFCPSSPRNAGEESSLASFLRSEQVQPESENAPKRVGVFVNSDTAEIVRCVKSYGLDYVQLHGSEDRMFVSQLKNMLVDSGICNIGIIKAINVTDEEDVKRWREFKDVADMLLFDTKGKAAGGNGKHFDWNVLKAYDGDLPFLLSGGIGSDDVGDVLAFSHKRMAGIDLNSRFETAPGLKDADKLRAFIEQIRRNEDGNSNE